MGLVTLTLLIGTINLAAGYLVAVQLGMGPSKFGLPWLGGGHRHTEDLDGEAFEMMLNDLVEADTDTMLEVDDELELDLQPLDEPYDDEAAALLKPDAPEAWDINEKYIETSILKLNVAMIKSGARVTEIDTRLRNVRGQSDDETIRDCWSKLLEDCETYLVEQTEAAEKFSDRIGELGELASLGEQIEFANMNQASQIETTVSNLKHMDFDTDLEAANLRLLEEISNLSAARHQLRDDQEAAFLTIARYENRLDKIEEKLFQDSLTGLRNRIGLETTLAEWWNQRRHTSRPISAVMLDLDLFGELNETQGCLMGDRVLYQLAQLMAPSLGEADLFARFGGQRFVVMVVDSGPRAAIKTAETLRQSIEQTVFVHGPSRFRVTVSGGVTEVSPEDETHIDVFERVEKPLKSAKAAGGNCLFSCERNQLGAEPERVEAPGFGIEEVEIEI